MPEQGEWRCSACESGEHLYACAGAVVSGKLLPDGSVSEDDTSQHTLHEDSIECSTHMSSVPLERWFDGRWCQWVPCTWEQRTPYPARPDVRSMDRVVRCVDGERVGYGRSLGPCASCEGKGGRWL